MASRMIGRTACFDCGFQSAHVKETEKCMYRYCPECNLTTHMKTTRQKNDLMEKTRPVDALSNPTPTATPTPTEKTAPAPAPQALPTPTDPTPTGPSPTPTPSPEPEAKPKRRGLFA